MTVITLTDAETTSLGRYAVIPGQSSVSGLSSGAFMTVQLHLAHSADFVGAGVIAGGPYRCAESHPGAAVLPEDALVQSALFICMTPLSPLTAPSAERLAALARQTAAQGEIDPIDHLAAQRVYLFSGSQDRVVYTDVVARTQRFYELLGVPPTQMAFHRDVPAGHAILTDNLEDSPLAANQPPYINDAGFMQSHDILRHIYGPLHPPAQRLTGRLLRFDQTEFFDGESRASMSRFGYVYVPKAVEEGAPARVHIVLHGCKQGYNYVDYVNGRPDVDNVPPYGSRFITRTGYNTLADSNNLIVLYPQAEGCDDGITQNPDGCWDWWGYSSPDPGCVDYYSRDAIQIRAIHRMLCRLGG